MINLKKRRNTTLLKEMLQSAVMLFLGAGASNAIGIGQLSDLTSKVLKKLESTKYSDVVKEILEKLSIKNEGCKYYDNDEIDIEVILSLLKKSVNPYESIKNLGPYAVFSSCTEEKIISITENDLIDMYKIIDREITNHCLSYEQERADRLYGELISLDEKINHKRTQHSSTDQKILTNIVTLNYDLVIESVYQNRGHNLVTGLKLEFAGGDQYVDLQEIFFNEKTQNEKIEYLKLHGSIDWRIRNSDGKIVKRDSGESLSRKPATRQMMIYPIFDKKVSDEFFFTFYYLFKRILMKHEIYLIIGYSFRDSAINDAFYFGLKANTNARMIISTTNQKVIERIERSFSDISNQVDIIRVQIWGSGFYREIGTTINIMKTQTS